MTSILSLLSLGSAGACSSGRVDVVAPRYAGSVHPAEGGCIGLKRSRCMLSLVVRNEIARAGGSTVSSDLRECNGVNADLRDRGSSKPTFNSASLGNSMSWSTRKLEADSGMKKTGNGGESKKVIDVLGDVLEKVEKLEHEKIKKTPPPLPVKLGISLRSGREGNLPASQKPGTRKSVWRKGDPIPSRPKAVKESSGVGLKVEREKTQPDGAEQIFRKRAIGEEPPTFKPLLPAQQPHPGLVRPRASSYLQHLESKNNRSVDIQDHVTSAPSPALDSNRVEFRADNRARVSPGAPQSINRSPPKLQPKSSIAPGAQLIAETNTQLPSKPTVSASTNLIAQQTKHQSVPLSQYPDRPKPLAAPHSKVTKYGPTMVESETQLPFKNMQPAKQILDVSMRKSMVQKPILVDRNLEVKGRKNHRERHVQIRKEENSKVVDGTDEETPALSASFKKPGVAREKKKDIARKKAAKLKEETEKVPVRVEILEVGEKGMIIEELASNLAVSEGELFRLLYSKGVKPDGVQTLDANTVKMICKEYDVEVIDGVPVTVVEMAKKKQILDEDDMRKLETRPPVLTIMGHVDHGKTTLLDYIRKSKVASLEAGGITQGIGAYKVLIPVDGKTHPCVFLDTPGHEAFAAMRARGAGVTDIVVIVVACDDGIQPQTNEAIAHAKAACVPIIIAINKIDKVGANPDRVMQELPSVGLTPEDWGGDVPVVQISALNGNNVQDLLEIIVLVAELQELKANPHREARGTVIEAALHKAKGPIATLIVQNGTLKVSDIIVCGDSFGKVRALFDHDQNRVAQAGPSIPVQIIGLNKVPIAGDEFKVVRSLDVAREMSEVCAERLRNEKISAKAVDEKVTFASFAAAVASGDSSQLDLHQLNLILKVDVQGSIEAIRQALQVLPQNNVTLKFLLEATGDVTQSDVDLAFAGKAIIVGFNVRLPGSLRSYTESKRVEVHLYKIIYELIDDVRSAMEGLLKPVEEQVPLGKAHVKASFSIGSTRVAGCSVTEGKVVIGCGLRVLRRDRLLHVGILHSLRHLKEEVKEVASGGECGIAIKDFCDWHVGDVIESFLNIRKKQTLEQASAAMSAAIESLKV